MISFYVTFHFWNGKDSVFQAIANLL
jgi:hypothetical protein